jgi:hypothetical protein
MPFLRPHQHLITPVAGQGGPTQNPIDCFATGLTLTRTADILEES